MSVLDSELIEGKRTTTFNSSRTASSTPHGWIEMNNATLPKTQHKTNHERLDYKIFRPQNKPKTPCFAK